jgi:hypothetical protein
MKGIPFITPILQVFSPMAAAGTPAAKPLEGQNPGGIPRGTLTAPGKLGRLNPAWIAVLARSLSQLRGNETLGASEHWKEAAAFWWKQLSGPPLQHPRRPRQVRLPGNLPDGRQGL